VSGRVAQTQTLSPEPEARAKTLNEFMQLLPRRERLAWAKLAEFRHYSCTKTPKQCQTYNSITLIQSVSSINP